MLLRASLKTLRAKELMVEELVWCFFGSTLGAWVLIGSAISAHQDLQDRAAAERSSDCHC